MCQVRDKSPTGDYNTQQVLPMVSIGLFYVGYVCIGNFHSLKIQNCFFPSEPLHTARSINLLFPIGKCDVMTKGDLPNALVTTVVTKTPETQYIAIALGTVVGIMLVIVFGFCFLARRQCKSKISFSTYWLHTIWNIFFIYVKSFKRNL